MKVFKKLFLNDSFILALILINSVVLFIGGYLPETIQARFAFSLIDNGITALFIVELLVKANECGLRNYLSSNWNKFDFVLVLLALPALITFVFNLQLIDFSFLLVFRILRVFKTFRFFKFIPNISELVSGVQRALKASVFVFLGFIIYIFIIGILSFYLFQSSGSEYFETPLISLYSTFKLFTIEGWFEIPEQVIKGYNISSTFFIYLYFIFVVLTGGIFGLSLVNSIFVDSMVSDNNDDLEKKIDNLDAKVSNLITKIQNHETRKDT